MSSALVSTLDYGRRLLDSGLEGAHSAEEEFLHGKPLAPFLNDSLRHALRPAALGACLGALGSYRHHSASRAFRYAVLGGAVGLAAGLAWEGRHLAASILCGALKNIDRVRDEHWFETHPIDYA
jgi:hypothetical protein